MLSCINKERDIDIFLSKEEIERLNSNTLEGTMLRIKEKETNTLTVRIDKDKSRYQIDVEDRKGIYTVYIHPEYYEDLKKSGHIGTRYGGLGDKIDILEKSLAKSMDDFRFEIRLLENFQKRRWGFSGGFLQK